MDEWKPLSDGATGVDFQDYENPAALVEAGAYARPLLSSTRAILVSVPLCVQFVTIFCVQFMMSVTYIY